MPKLHRLLIVSLLVGLAAWGGITLLQGSGRITTIWPANGLLLGILLIAPRRQWTAYLIGSYVANFAANALTGDSLRMATGLALCNTVEVFLSARLIQRFSPSPFDLRNRKTLLTFVLVGVGLAPTVSALLAISWISLINGNALWLEPLRKWYAADALGVLTVTPCMWALQQGKLRDSMMGKNLAASVLCLGLLAMVTTLTFSQSYYVLLFTVYPFLLIVVLRLGFAGAATGAFLVAAISTTFTVLRLGPMVYLSDPSLANRVLILQFYIATAIATALPFAALLEERRSMERSIRSSEEHYRSLFENAPYGIYRTSAGSDYFLAANPALAATLGYGSVDELMQVSLSRNIYCKQDRSLLLEARKTQDRFEEETQWMRRDGKTIDVRLSGRRLNDGNEQEEFEVMAEDTTEKKLLEAKVRQSQKMEAIGRLAGGVAHDFNNLLMVTINYSKMIQEDVTDLAAVSRYTRQILDTSNKAAALTQQLLAFSRKQPQKLTVLDLNVVVTEFCGLLPNLIGEDIQLIIGTKAESPRVYADRTQLEQVIMNLVVNARDAMPQGGRLVVETRSVDLGVDHSEKHNVDFPPGKYIMLSLTDSGSGMDEETRARIFEPFFTTKVGKGTGLGLATVYGIVKQSKGFIWVHSELGKGTTFKVYLPQVSGDIEAAPALKPAPSPATGKETILIVEDQKPLREVMGEYLTARGFNVLLAEDGEAAVQIAQQYKDLIHLLLTDVVMPGMRGPEVVRRVLEIHPESRSLYISGYSDLALQGEINSEDIVQKPVDLGVLTQRIRELLDRKN